MALVGQVRQGCPSMAPLGYVQLKKVQKLLESRMKSKNENEIKNENSFLFSSLFLLSFFNFCFFFHFRICFFFFIFVFVFAFFFLFVVVFLLFFQFFIFKFYYGASRPPCTCQFNNLLIDTYLVQLKKQKLKKLVNKQRNVCSLI